VHEQQAAEIVKMDFRPEKHPLCAGNEWQFGVTKEPTTR